MTKQPGSDKADRQAATSAERQRRLQHEEAVRQGRKPEGSVREGPQAKRRPVPPREAARTIGEIMVDDQLGQSDNPD